MDEFEKGLMRLKTMVDLVEDYMGKSQVSRDPLLWLKLVIEELAELNMAILHGDKEEILKEFVDVNWVNIGFVISSQDNPDFEIEEYQTSSFEKMFDYLTSLSEVLGEDFDADTVVEAFKLVYENNLARLYHDDGKIYRREDGKILKNPNAPKIDLSGLV